MLSQIVKPDKLKKDYNFLNSNKECSDDLIAELDSIEKDMLNSGGIPFKDIDELKSRYKL